MFALGPLVFWATAEMTCGFFIICVPCMPKILQQTGVLGKVKKVLGMSTGPSAGTPGKPGYYASGGSGSRGPRGPGSNLTNLSGTGPDSYYKLGEDGVPMGTLTSSESTEHLRDDNRDDSGKLSAAAHNAAITRTTHIAVTEDSRSTSDGGSNIDMQLYKQKVPWHGASK